MIDFLAQVFVALRLSDVGFWTVIYIFVLVIGWALLPFINRPSKEDQ